MGVTSTRGILIASAKSGLIATIFLGLIYVGVAYLGASSTSAFGLFDTGGPVLGKASSYYFGSFGTVMLSVIILLACLTTSIGLMTACGEYFHTLLPKISYKMWVLFFSLVSFVIANFGLSNIINFSIPVLMLLYPLAIALMLLTFLSKLFNHSRIVYAAVIIVTFMISIIDGFKTLCDLLGIEYFVWLEKIVNFYERVLPFYHNGLGWLLPVLVTIILTGSIVGLQNFSSLRVKNKTESVS